jgi:hypothetical protein
MAPPDSIRAREWTPCELYQAYESARDDTELALQAWNRAAPRDRRDAFVVYRAEVERENAAAVAWMRAAAAHDAGLSTAA